MYGDAADFVVAHGAHAVADDFTAEWFPEQRAFYEDTKQLVATIKGRRSGATRGGCRHFIRLAQSIPGARLLYLNETRGEAERLAWYGGQNDGMASLCERYKLNVKQDQTDLSLHFTDNDSWIWLRGAKDEKEVRKALGGAYHEVWWDEAQKIPAKLGPTIREVFMPALLDFGGRFRLSGTPVRNMSGLFWDATRPDAKRDTAWSLHGWTLLDNPFFGASYEERWQRGIVGLQNLYGGPDVAPIDSPIMQREAFGRWVREDAAYVYAVHKVPTAQLFYAPARQRADGFPDITAALKDLPGDWREYMFAMGVDIGWYPDPFAFVLWAWNGQDPRLYEVAGFKRNHLTSDEQVDCIRAVREHVNIGLIVADASGPAKPTVKGWSKEMVARYNLPIIEAEKQHKYPSIDTMNTDILSRDSVGNSRLALRDGGLLYDEMSQLQYSSVVSATGKLVEDPTLANDVCDAGLYAHRHSYQYRWRPDVVPPKPGSVEALAKEETELEDERLEEMDDGSTYFH